MFLKNNVCETNNKKWGPNIQRIEEKNNRPVTKDWKGTVIYQKKKEKKNLLQ